MTTPQLDFINSPQLVFKTNIAIKYGLEASVFIQHLQYSIGHHQRNNTNFHEERYWTYDSSTSLLRHYPFWTRRQIDSIIKKLVDEKIIFVGNFNAKKYDRTRWFAFVDEDRFLESFTSENPQESTYRENEECEKSSLHQNEQWEKSLLFKHKNEEIGGNPHCTKTCKALHQTVQPIPIYTSIYKDREANLENLPESPVGVFCKNAPQEDQIKDFRRSNSKGTSQINNYSSKTGIESRKSKTLGGSEERRIIYITEIDNNLNNSLPKNPNDVNQLFSNEKKSTIKNKDKRGARLSESWDLPNEWREWSVNTGMFNEEVDLTEIKFKNYWLSTTKNATKLNWFRTWQNWCVSEYEKKGKTLNLKPKSSTSSAIPCSVNNSAFIAAQISNLPKSTDPIIQAWNNSQENLAFKLKEKYQSWIKDLRFEGIINGKAIFIAKNKFTAEYVKNNFRDNIYSILQKIDPKLSEYNIEIKSVC